MRRRTISAKSRGAIGQKFPQILNEGLLTVSFHYFSLSAMSLKTAMAKFIKIELK